jgi:hypothetical protein
MKSILPLFFALMSVLLISSCAVQPVQKELIGTWKVMKIKQLNTPGTMASIGEKDKNSQNDTTTNPVKSR